MIEYKPQQDVSDFMLMCDQEVHQTPTIPSTEILLLRAKLLFEEVNEFVEAAGCFIGVDHDGDLSVFNDEDMTPDLVEMYDAICDIEYVNAGAACALGLDLAAGFEEVHRSNMTKRHSDGLIHKTEFGKVIKPSTYSPADLKYILSKQVK